MVKVAVDPDCKEIGPQLMFVLLEVPPPHVPELILPVMLVRGTKVAPGLIFEATMMLLARSGPLFWMV
jgi:hypothetical protein